MSERSDVGTGKRAGLHTALGTVVLAVLWLLFSGKFDVLHLAYGALSVVLVLALSRHLFTSISLPKENQFLSHIRWGQAFIFPFWLAWQVLTANFQVAAMVLRPKLDIDPFLMRVPFSPRSRVAKVVLGNSITLTPGTFTIAMMNDAEGDELLVHSIADASAGSLFDGSMQARVAAVFGEEAPPAPSKIDSFSGRVFGGDRQGAS